MRRIVLWTAAAVISVTILGAVDIFSQLGTTEASVRDNLLQALDTGSFSTGMAAKPYHALPAVAQATLAEGYVAWARSYTTSPAFKQAYATRRAEAKPQLSEVPDHDPNKLKADQQKQFEEMQKAVAAMPAEQRKEMEQVIREMQKQLTAMANDPEMTKAMAEGVKMQREMNAKQHQEDLAAWNQKYPEDPNVLIARRLKQFLDVSATVDFNAKLERANDKMRFADTRYEQKPAEWKTYYRAGRTAVTAAQAAARAWLKELPAGSTAR